MKLPIKKSKWRHHSGKIYEVLVISNVSAKKADYPVTVVYQDEAGEVWSRPLALWHDSMKEIV